MKQFILDIIGVVACVLAVPIITIGATLVIFLTIFGVIKEEKDENRTSDPVKGMGSMK